MRANPFLLYLEPRSDYDKCIVRTDTNQVVYSRRKIIKVLMTRDGMNADEATEFYDFNIAGAYMGPNMPKFVR